MNSQATVAIASRPRLPGRWLEALLPMSARCSMLQRCFLVAALGCQLVMMLLTLVHAFTGLGGPAFESAIHGVVAAVSFSISAAIVVLRATTERRHRALWATAAASIVCYALAMDLWGFWLEHARHPPYPSVCDFIWWTSYALAAATIIGAAGSQARRGGSLKIWLDGLIASTATAAFAAAFVLAPVVNSAQGAHEVVLNELVYPLGDVVLGALLIGVVGLAGWRLDRRRVILAVGFVFLLTSDTANSIQVADGALIANSAIQLFYMAAFTCAAIAAWQSGSGSSRMAERTDSVTWSALLVPACFTVTAPVILVYDHFSRVPLAAFLLTMVALLAAMVRLALALRDMLTVKDLQRAAFTDELTDLPNRRMFSSKLRDMVEEADREGGSVITLMLDLDNFKQLNDTLGHDAGDELLRLVGPRLKRALHSDSLVARLGGDEFAVILPPDAGPLQGVITAKSVLGSFNEPFKVHGLVLRLTPSVGIATYPRDANSPETLLKCADVAMYEAKRSRRGYENYSADRDSYTRERLQLSGELAVALERGEIEVMFQAMADADTRMIRCAEALVRWRQPDGTLRPPIEFLEAAELAGLSRQLTRRVLTLALDNVCDWRAAGHAMSVAVNTAAADLLDESFPDEIEAALTSRGLTGEALKIEVTESSILANPTAVGAVLKRLRDLDVGIGLDDFGTGYSSLTHLRQLPVSRLKIDRSFVTNMCTEPSDAAIVYATIELAHKLNLRVVAEGVEDEATWQALLELGCDAVQGYWLNKPMESAAFRELLDCYLADSQSLPTPASTASGGSIS